MRKIALLTLALIGLADPVSAEEKVWTPAPQPSIGAGDTVMPAARAGVPVENDHSTPFSSLPSNSVTTGGATSADQYNGVQTPNLSK